MPRFARKGRYLSITGPDGVQHILRSTGTEKRKILSEGGSEWERVRGNAPRNNQAQNKQFDDATKGLSKAEQELVHREITGKGFGYQKIQEIVSHHYKVWVAGRG